MEFSGRGDLSERQQKLGQHLSELTRIAEEFNIAVVVINQCMADPGAMSMFVSVPRASYCVASFVFGTKTKHATCSLTPVSWCLSHTLIGWLCGVWSGSCDQARWRTRPGTRKHHSRHAEERQSGPAHCPHLRQVKRRKIMDSTSIPCTFVHPEFVLYTVLPCQRPKRSFRSRRVESPTPIRKTNVVGLPRTSLYVSSISTHSSILRG